MSRPIKRTLPATLVKRLLHKRTDRGFILIEHASRCVRAGEVHELVTTDTTAIAGSRCDRVGFVGFIEMKHAGVIEHGDLLTCGGKVIGRVLGFDACHFPNHYNILVQTATLLTATELNVEVEDIFEFVPAESTVASGEAPHV